MTSILLFSPVLAMGLLLAPAPPPRPAHETVTVGSLHLRIPDLPRDVADAKARRKSILRQTEQDLAEIEKALKDAPPGTAPLRIPSTRAAETQRLLDHLRDPVYPQLEQAMALQLQALVAAHTAPKTAVTPGPTQAKPTRPMAGSPPPLRHVHSVPGAAEYGVTDVARILHDQQEGGDEKANQAFTAEIKFRKHQQGTMIHQDRHALATWDQQLPALAEAWGALTRHLAQQAVRVTDLLAVPNPTKDPTMEALKHLLQHQLLQRYQASLKIGLELWRSAAG